jgi:hypothetical protein
MCGLNPCSSPDCTWSEKYRDECEARAVCAMPSKEDRQNYLARVEKERGTDAAARLKTDVKIMWGKTRG